MYGCLGASGRRCWVGADPRISQSATAKTGGFEFTIAFSSSAAIFGFLSSVADLLLPLRSASQATRARRPLQLPGDSFAPRSCAGRVAAARVLTRFSLPG